jgi:hypothetical protein
MLLQRKKKLKNVYVISRKCRNVWANQFPWANLLKSESGKVHHVKCMVYSFVRGKDVILRSKTDTLEKHVGKAKDVRDMPHLGKKHGGMVC